MPQIPRWCAVLLFTTFAATLAVAQDAPPALTDDPTTWPADIKTAWDEIVLLPGSSKDAVKNAIFALAANGRLARPAMAALAHKADLPEPQRAFAGILLAHFARFDAPALRKLAEDANPFAQRESIVLLGQLGGKENTDFLEALARKTASEGLKTHIGKAVAGQPEAPLPARALELLDRIVNADADAKKTAAAALSEDFGKSAAPALHAIIRDAIADDDARTFAAAALVQVNAGSVADLEALCARANHKTLRYCAVLELAKHGTEGEAVLRKLAADPDEPLKKRIESLLTPPEK